MQIKPTFTPRSVLYDFLPWIVYGVSSAFNHERLGILLGLGAVVFQIASEVIRRRVKILDIVTLIFFVAGFVDTVLLNSSIFETHKAQIIWSVFAITAWGSLLIRSPFTLQYARDEVPLEVSQSPRFFQVNVAITFVWGVIFLINLGLAFLLQSSFRTTIWMKLLPYLTVVFGIIFTNRYPQWVHKKSVEN